MAARLDALNRPQASFDWVDLLLGVASFGGTLIALMAGGWLWAAIIFLGSIIIELLVALARRRRARRAQSP